MLFSWHRFSVAMVRILRLRSLRGPKQLPKVTPRSESMCRSEILEIPTIAGENSRVFFWLAGSFKPDREAISVGQPPS